MQHKKNNNPVTEDGADDFFLPNFCAPQALAMLVIVAELLALLLVLAAADHLEFFPWDRFALTSFLVQWISLVNAALLCKLRKPLMRLRSSTAAGLSFVLVVGLVALFSWLAEPMLRLAHIAYAYPVTGQDIVRNVLMGAIVAGLIMRYFYLQEQLRARQRTELTARLQALQSRIRPHFLFNSMNIIASLIHVDPDKAEQAVEDLSELFRASLRAEGEVGLNEELELCQHYVNIEKFRLGDRLRVEWQLNAVPEQVRIPALTLQPLIENAIYHGVEPRSEPSTVKITVDYDGRDVSIIITNPVGHAPVSSPRGNRMALNNIRQRLMAHYGETAKLTTHTDGSVHTTYVSYPLSLVPGKGIPVTRLKL
ncbi:MAG TPA: sensor histidine kinase, partial [Moraxellaceae bacterium]|nr:sensor histidine kinase [Moraxellaceae bacterium]